MLTREEEIGLAYGAWVTSHPVGADHGDSFIAGAQWADKNPKNKWRDVTIQPKANVEVLADVIDFNANNNIFHDLRIAFLSPLDGKWYTPNGEPVRVAYWQPLPELPKDDE
jgi:hypothetical protein